MGNRERPLAAGLLLLWILALILALTGLGGVPLVDWDEGIVARVALESSQAPWPDRLWPTSWGEPYLNKPPLIHWLIAACIDLWRQLSPAAATATATATATAYTAATAGTATLPPEWLLRLGPALLSSLIVPLLGLIQWRLRPGQRGPALATAAIALTLLPLARQGHRVMLDGSQLVAIALLWWALLGSMTSWRRTLGWGALAGLAGSALLLLKAPTALPVLASALVLLALERDLRPRQWLLLALALLVGLLPGLAWHLGHWLVRGDGALQMWLGQGYARIGTAIEGHRDGPLSAVLEMVEGGWPWLPLWPFGLALAWRARSSRAGLWCLGLTLAMSLMVLPLRTQLPWYSLLLWPPFALVCGPVLAALVARPRPDRLPGAGLLVRLPRLWALIGALVVLLALLALAGVLPPLRPAAAIALVFGASLLGGGWLLTGPEQRLRRLGALVMVLGSWLALLLLLASPLWLWELRERWPVPRLAALLSSQGPAEVRLWQEQERPSLNWYAGRRLRGEDHLDLATGESILLLSLKPPQAPDLRCQALADPAPLTLYRCRRSSGPDQR
ncbi:MAG: 4-amino-4-deoxy-L-arabinose transferase [Cyanobacteria bacterium]|nr:4-amino-4-deoxy-L-arabinose transferase [Cyanobacteriota bacterium]